MHKRNLRKFSWLRIISLMLLTMLFYNISMSIITGSLWESLINNEISKLLIGLLVMSIGGLILSPASLALILFGSILEKIYVRKLIHEYWIFCISAGVIGVTIFMTIVFLYGKGDFDFVLLPLMFIIHLISTMLIYRGKFSSKNNVIKK